MKGERKRMDERNVLEKKVDKSLNLSIREGSVASVASSIGESYVPPFALALKATSSQVGILHAVMELLPSIVQIRASRLLESYSRKKIVLNSLIFRVLLWLPIILCGYLFYVGFPYAIWLLILFVGLYYSVMAISQMTWFSWMGSLVPENKRGDYFSKRDRIVGFWGMVSMVLAAIFLDSAKKVGMSYGAILEFTLFGFGLLFSISLLLRAWTYFDLKEQYEPTLHIRKKDQFTFKRFFNSLTKTPFGKFVFFRGIMSIAIAVASPFWAVYMIRDLGFSYFWFMAITVAGVAFQLIFFPLLGKAADKYGNVAIMRVCINLAFIIPLTWLFTPFIDSTTLLKVYLLIVPSAISGFVWAGYNLSTSNYVYDAVKAKKVGFGVSYMNLFIGIGGFMGALIGSFIAYLDVSFMNPILFIFAVSVFLRALIAWIGSRYLKEVRHVERFSSEYLLREIVPMKGIVRDLHHSTELSNK
jgi:MFS family permease